MTREEAHNLVDFLFDNENSTSVFPGTTTVPPEVVLDTPDEVSEEPKPTAYRAVRSSSGGDRVFYIDEEANTRQWVTNPEVLKSYGFDLTDVVEVEEQELLRYTMASPLYKLREDAEA